MLERFVQILFLLCAVGGQTCTAEFVRSKYKARKSASEAGAVMFVNT